MSERDEEWMDRYNPFNSFKALVHSAHFDAILDRKPLPPIVVNFDLTNECNYNCRFCMFGGRRERMDSTGQQFRLNRKKLPVGYALTLPKLWKEWGVKASCLAGGGEPTLHPDCLPFIREMHKEGIELGFVSNGLLVNNKKWWDIVASETKFVGFSIDAGNREDYKWTKGVKAEFFDKVIKNLREIAKAKEKTGGQTQIGYKFLLDEMNYQSIYDAAKIGSEMGANHFHFRPAIATNLDFFSRHAEAIWGQIRDAQNDFESADYKIVGVKHKFNLDFSRKHKFEKCRATMLTTTWCADGTVVLCTDTRGNPWSYLIDHYPDPHKVIEFWGSKEHWAKVDKIDFHNNCDRCTLTSYQEFFEQVFIKDKMDRYLI